MARPANLEACVGERRPARSRDAGDRAPTPGERGRTLLRRLSRWRVLGRSSSLGGTLPARFSPTAGRLSHRTEFLGSIAFARLAANFRTTALDDASAGPSQR